MTLLDALLEITADWRTVFPQARTWRRGVRQALGSLVCLGRRCLTRIIWTNGGQGQSWSAEYFLHSRCCWNAQDLFLAILRRALPMCPGQLVGVAVDDTRLSKTGRCIPQAFYQRDPLSPPFHVNLMLGLRFLQASLLVPSHRRAPLHTRGLPIRFEEAPSIRKPGRKASPEAWDHYKAAAKRHALSSRFVQMVHDLRQALDAVGGASKILVIAGDGSFCNRTCLGVQEQRTELILRARKDAVLCGLAPDHSRRFYDSQTFTPEQVRQDDSVPWQTTKICYGGKRRNIRYKDVTGTYWRRAAGRRPLRLLVVAPTPYLKRKSAKTYYRRPAYLLTTDLTHQPRALLQIYFDRWQIEVNHRDEKDAIGVGQAQLWNPTSVAKQPVLTVAAYSALLLASIIAFGPGRGAAYAPLPRWRRRAQRPSCLDLLTLLRKDMTQHPELLAHLDITLTHRALTSAAAA